MQPKGMCRKRSVVVTVFVGIVLFIPCSAAGQEQVTGKPGEIFQYEKNEPGITPESARAIERGLRFLADRQQEDGSWKGSYGRNTGVASYATLSFMSVGDLPQGGNYARQVARGIDYVMSQAQSTGLIVNPSDTSNGPMYEHALSTLLLAEALGEYHRPALADTLKRAVDLIVRTQNKEGGWRYEPVPGEADISVTVMQLVALRAARNAGLAVPATTINAAVKYVKSCASPGGGFLYQPGVGEPGYARTAAGVCSLLIVGEYKTAEVKNGIRYLQENKSPEIRGDLHLLYGLHYAAKAMYLYPDRRQWAQWYPPIRQELLAMQKEDGHFDGEAGPIYGTAVSVLILTVPHHYMPIYQH
jgi:prenyltransferase beta subunit